MNKLAQATGSGWKGYTGGAGMAALGVLKIVEAVFNIEIPPEVYQGLLSIAGGLGIFGIRDAVAKKGQS